MLDNAITFCEKKPLNSSELFMENCRNLKTIENLKSSHNKFLNIYKACWTKALREDSDDLPMMKRMRVKEIQNTAQPVIFEGKRSKGRPRLRWIDTIIENIKTWIKLESITGIDKTMTEK